MTDLTEQRKKGGLPEGYYYCKTENGAEILRTWVGIDKYVNLENKHSEVYISAMDDCKIIAPVPSYEEWQVKLEENARLKKQINHVLRTQARQFVDNQKLQVKAEKAKDVVNIDMARQIIKLKELLKKCKSYVNSRLMKTRECLNKPYTATDKVLHKKAEKLLTKIDEALK